MEFNIGKKKVTLTKRQIVRGTIAFTAGAGAYIIVRQAIKTNVPSETMNFVGKAVVALGGFFLANAVADEVQKHTSKFVNECFDSYDNAQKAAQEMADDIRNAQPA